MGGGKMRMSRAEWAELTTAYVMIKAEVGEASRIAEEIGRLEAVRWAVVVTGPYDILVGVRVRNNLELGRLVVNQMHNIAGVEATSTAVLIDYRPPRDPTQGVEWPP
jgi:DNA-binding Lrp family transcriptional regulator